MGRGGWGRLGELHFGKGGKYLGVGWWVCEEGSLETDENQTASVIQNYSDERLGETANPLWCINKKKGGESAEM